MKNLYDRENARDIRERIERLRPESARQWGKMNPPQMLAHLAEFMAMACDDVRPPRMFVGRLFGRFVKRLTVDREDRAVPKNAPTVPGCAIGDERDFEKERARLLGLVDRFIAGGPAACTTHPHAFFGRLTPDEWAVLMYKHLDHHLRQFSA
ncbi:MAG TPA: DUF1569 domain-containing protein [Thermoanaerobaculia bacterium]|nr:DUF1569 domain-containing protein [Thermoanaerobaculia bacterium]